MDLASAIRSGALGDVLTRWQAIRKNPAILQNVNNLYGLTPRQGMELYRLAAESIAARADITPEPEGEIALPVDIPTVPGIPPGTVEMGILISGTGADGGQAERFTRLSLFVGMTWEQVYAEIEAFLESQQAAYPGETPDPESPWTIDILDLFAGE